MDAFFFAIAVAVGLTPEMLPMIVNANLARGAMALSRRRPSSSSSTPFRTSARWTCSAPTRPARSRRTMWCSIKHVDVHGEDSQRVLQYAYLNSLFQTGLKNLLDRAVVERARIAGLRELARSFRKIDEIPFDFNRRRMSVVLRPGSSDVESLWSAKARSRRCCKSVRRWKTADRVVPLTDAMREQAQARCVTS